MSKLGILKRNSRVAIIIVATLFILLFIFTSKGPSLMERIQENTSAIDTILIEKTTKPYEGITLTETSFLCQGQLNHMYVLQVDLESGFSFRPSTPKNRPISGEKQNMLDQALEARQAGIDVYYAINADVFGGYRNDLKGKPVPLGVVYIEGKPYQKFHHRTAENVFYVKKDGGVEIDKYPIFEDELAKENVLCAVGGWHTLVWNGEKAIAPDDFLGNGYHPRTFIGVNKDRTKAYVFVVDGRQPEYSNGLQMNDMIDICFGVGCDRAINFDGGGSTTLVQYRADNHDFILLNTPSDEGNLPREVVDGLMIIRN